MLTKTSTAAADYDANVTRIAWVLRKLFLTENLIQKEGTQSSSSAFCNEKETQKNMRILRKTVFGDKAPLLASNNFATSAASPARTASTSFFTSSREADEDEQAIFGLRVVGEYKSLKLIKWI